MEDDPRIKTLIAQVARLQRQLELLTKRFETYCEMQNRKNLPLGPSPRRPLVPRDLRSRLPDEAIVWPPSTRRLK